MMTLFRKEWMELTRSYRLLFVPLILVFLALSNIILMKMLPDMLKSGAGNLPPGTVIEIPPPTAADAVLKMFGQFDQLGVLVLILVLMGGIAGERASGVMTTILLKPVSRYAYVGAKTVAAIVLVLVSYGAAVGISYYYVLQLFTDTPAAGSYWLGCLLYLPKLVFVALLVLFFSAWGRSSVAAGGLSLVTVVAVSLVGGLDGLQGRTPAALTGLAEQALRGQALAVGDWLGPIGSTLLLCGLLYWGAVALASRREG